MCTRAFARLREHGQRRAQPEPPPLAPVVVDPAHFVLLVLLLVLLARRALSVARAAVDRRRVRERAAQGRAGCIERSGVSALMPSPPGQLEARVREHAHRLKLGITELAPMEQNEALLRVLGSPSSALNV